MLVPTAGDAAVSGFGAAAVAGEATAPAAAGAAVAIDCGALSATWVTGGGAAAGAPAGAGGPQAIDSPAAVAAVALVIRNFRRGTRRVRRRGDAATTRTGSKWASH